MNRTAEQHSHPWAGRHRWWQGRWFKVASALSLLVAVCMVFVAEYVLHNAEPILRRRIVETLSARFQAPVELEGLSISLFKGIEVEGSGLRVSSLAEAEGGSPMLLSVRRFAFRTSFRSLMRQPTYVRRVEVEGMDLHVPPADARARLVAGWTAPGDGTLAVPGLGSVTPKISLVVGQLRCTDIHIVLDPGKPAMAEAHARHRAKAPPEFNIRTLTLQHLGAQGPMPYEADLINPKPVGEVYVAGELGPWGGATGGATPGSTPLDGSYSFTHADLRTIRGLGGTLSSTGQFSGVLNRIGIDGETDTPDFSLDVGSHPVPLQTRFRAVVDGTSGDTFLPAVQARLNGSEFTTSGKIVKLAGQGRDIDLTVDIPHGRMEDFLRLAVRTSPPLMNGWLTMHTTLHIPPGPARVAEKMAMTGTFSLRDVRFNNARLQHRIDGLSARATGHPERIEARDESARGRVPVPSGSRLARHSALRSEAGSEPRVDPIPESISERYSSHSESRSESPSQSQLSARFTLARGVLDVTDVHFALPGATAQMNGVYSMDGRLFEFRGRVRTVATASEMVGGWKGLLLQPLDRFLAKNGAGVELPIEISGTQGDVNLGLAPPGGDATPTQLLADVQAKQAREVEIRSARREGALADKEDAAAARAPTLEAAERAHASAVRHRAEAQRLASSARQP